MPQPARLAPGTILGIALAAGIAVPAGGHKRPIRCPLHEDGQPSAFLDVERNVFYCSVCTPDGGLSARRFAGALGQSWATHGPTTARLDRHRAASFTAAHAQVAWAAALARSRDDDAVESDRPVYDYLCKRGLADAWEEAAFGVLAGGNGTHPALLPWLRSGHRLVAPLFDSSGCVVSIHGRAIYPAAKKTLFPLGSQAKGTLFASKTGLSVLKGCWTGVRQVVLGEGMTDFLALSITSPVPVLSAPGTSFVASSISSWVKGLEVLLAVDCDAAGDNVVAETTRWIFRNGGHRVRRLRWPRGSKDACEVLDNGGAPALTAVLEAALGV